MDNFNSLVGGVICRFEIWNSKIFSLYSVKEEKHQMSHMTEQGPAHR